jgi:cysteine desulfurase/selenocysteine lyase
VDYYESNNANVHRAVHTLSLEATEMYEKAREKTAQFINAKEATETIFVKGTTEAINLVAYTRHFYG